MVRWLKIKETEIEGLKLIAPLFFPDERGYFCKVFEKGIFSENGIFLSPHEEMQSCSAKGVVRGLHFQRNHNQDKLVRVIRGSVYDVAVDLRKGSNTFGEWRGFYLTDVGREMLYIPKGFAHGFLALEEDTLFSYMCGDKYDPESDGGIKWDDPDIGVDWPLDKVEKVIVSDKDKGLQSFNMFVDTFGGIEV